MIITMKTDRRLNKGIAIPLYRQLKDILEERIRRGDYRPGERLPTEKELCQQFGVSRITVRQALSELANGGLLYSHQGSGTFLNHRLPLKVRALQAVVTEERWDPPLREAVKLCNEGRQGEQLRLEVQALGRPQLHSKIVSAVGRGEAPDLALIDWAWMTEFADLQYIEALDELDREWVEELKADLSPLFVENNSYRGHFYGVQPEVNVSLVWYRRDWFEDQGLCPPRNWEELVAAARHLQETGVRRKYGLGPFPIAFPGGPGAGETTTYILAALIWSAGGEFVSDGRILFNGGACQALGFLHDLIHKHLLTSPGAPSHAFNEVPRLFARGEVALAFGGSYEKSLIQEVAGWDDEAFRKRVGFVPIPAGPGGRQATTIGGMVYVIFRQSSHPESALEILKFLAGSPLMAEFCRKTGRKPTRISAMQTLNSERDWFIYETSRLLEVARIRPTIPQYPRISKQLQMMLASILEKRESIDGAIARTQAIIEALT